MSPLPVIAEIYMLCTGIGAIFVIFSAIMGAGHGHGGGHGAHAGSGPHIHAGGHTGIGAHLQASARAGASGHAGVGARAQAGSHNAPTQEHVAPANTNIVSASRNPGVLVKDKNSTDALTSVLLTYCNPTLISVFLVFFGSIGIISWRLLSIPIEWTLPIALLGGFLGAKLVSIGLSWLFSNLFASANYTIESLIGCQGEITVSVSNGKIGEVMYCVGARRYTASAKASDSSCVLKRGQQVVIMDMQNDIAVVSPLLDEGSTFDAELAKSAEKLSSQRLDPSFGVPSRQEPLSDGKP